MGLVGIGHEIIMRLIRDHRIFAIGQILRERFGGDAVRRAGCRAMIVLTDDDQSRLLDFLNPRAQITGLTGDHVAQIVFQAR